MDILGPLVDFWLGGGFDVIRHPISYHNLSSAVRSAKRVVNRSIGHDASLEDVAAVLAVELLKIEELGKVYQGGEPLPPPSYLQSAEAWTNTPKEEKARHSFERDWHGPSRRYKTITRFLGDLWTPFYDYGNAKGVNRVQVEQLVYQKM